MPSMGTMHFMFLIPYYNLDIIKLKMLVCCQSIIIKYLKNYNEKHKLLFLANF